MPGPHQEMCGPGMLQASGADQPETKVFAHLRGQNLMRRSARGGVYIYGNYPSTPLPRGTLPGTFPPEYGQKTRSPGGGGRRGGNLTRRLRRVYTDIVFCSPAATATGSAAPKPGPVVLTTALNLASAACTGVCPDPGRNGGESRRPDQVRAMPVPPRSEGEPTTSGGYDFRIAAISAEIRGYLFPTA